MKTKEKQPTRFSSPIIISSEDSDAPTPKAETAKRRNAPPTSGKHKASYVWSLSLPFISHLGLGLFAIRAKLLLNPSSPSHFNFFDFRFFSSSDIHMPLHAGLLVSPKVRPRIPISRMLPTVVVKTIFRHRSSLCPRRERKRRQLGIRLLRSRVPLSMLKILLSRLQSAPSYLPPPQRAFTLRTCELTFSSSLFVSLPDCTTSSVRLPRQKPLLLLFLLTMQTGPQLAPPISCIPAKMDRPRLSSLSPKLSIFLRAQLYSAYIPSFAFIYWLIILFSAGQSSVPYGSRNVGPL